jgi:hypothetical protein
MTESQHSVIFLITFIGEFSSRLPLSGCGSPVETSAKQKHRPNRQVRLSCLRSRLRGSQFTGKLSLPPSKSRILPPPSSEGGITIATQFLHFALCALHFALPDKLHFVCCYFIYFQGFSTCIILRYLV